MHRKMVLCAVLLLVSVVQAQELLPLNQLTIGDITLENPNVTYRLPATSGQSLQFEVVEVANALAPQFTLTDANGTLINSIGNPTLSTSVETTINFVQTGEYSVSVSSASGITGQFVIRVSEAAPVGTMTALSVGLPVSGTLTSGQQVGYLLNGDLSLPQVLTVDGRVSASLKGMSGDIAAISSQLEGGSFNLPANAESYQLVLLNDSPIPSVDYTVALTPRGAALPISTPEVGATEIPLPVLPTTGTCVLATLRNEAVNIRQGPGTEFSQITTMSPQTIYTVVGRNLDMSWWEIDYGGGRGWVAEFVTRRGGDCSNVPITYSPATPQPTATIPIAGDNENRGYEVRYERGEHGLFGQISYPQGDREDTITYQLTDIPSPIPTGSNRPQFRYSIRCTGDGVEFAVIEFLDGSTRPCTPEAANYQVLFSESSARTGGFTIKLTDGENAYVQWIVYLSWYIP